MKCKYCAIAPNGDIPCDGSYDELLDMDFSDEIEAEKGTGVYRRGIKKACESGDACMGKHWEYAL